MNLTFEHNNVLEETVKLIQKAISDNEPFALKSPKGVIKVFDPRTNQSRHFHVTMTYISLQQLLNDVSFTLYRFKEFVSIQQFKELGHDPRQIESK